LLDYRLKQDTPKIAATEQIIGEIQSNRTGAFATLSRHPLLAAMLLPTGGIGLWALLSYLANAM
jgi:hypothetical protein